MTTDVTLLAAKLWAQAHRHGRPTVESKALNGDVILAAQAPLLTQVGHNVTIATNVKHLLLFVKPREWQTLKE